MERLITWLATPEGGSVVHAVVLLASSCAAVLSALAVRITHGNSKLLNGHLAAHERVAPREIEP